MIDISIYDEPNTVWKCSTSYTQYIKLDSSTRFGSKFMMNNI
jgi:hypothetical protein